MAQIMTTKEATKYLRMREISILKYASAGKIPAVRIGSRWRFDKEAIDKWLAGGSSK
jgi:excisionase family DNA binding protein